MKCENCNTDHNGEYGSGRFCCQKCARSFATIKDRSIRNDQISKTLKGRKRDYKEIVEREIRKCKQCTKPI